MVRGKFTCESKKSMRYGTQVEFQAVYGGTPEDNTYSEATPAGSLSLTVTKAGVADQFTIGTAYYLDITEAPAQ